MNLLLGRLFGFRTILSPMAHFITVAARIYLRILLSTRIPSIFTFPGALCPRILLRRRLFLGIRPILVSLTRPSGKSSNALGGLRQQVPQLTWTELWRGILLLTFTAWTPRDRFFWRSSSSEGGVRVGDLLKVPCDINELRYASCFVAKARACSKLVGSPSSTLSWRGP